MAWSFAARAQQRSLPVVGFLNGGSPDGYAPMVSAFRQGLKETGYVEGQNVTIEYRYAQGRPERLPELATDLVKSKPDVIFALGGDVAPHVAKATHTIPIIYAMSADPVQLGIVANLMDDFEVGMRLTSSEPSGGFGTGSSSL